MKKTSIIAAIIMFAGFCTVQAAKFRVNNQGFGANYSSIIDAINDTLVLDGDTLYIEPSSVPYAGVTLTKKLVLIGPGYFIGSNPMTQANPNSAIINHLNFNAGSQGSVVQGLHFVGKMTVNTSNIVIKRNRFHVNDKCIHILTGVNNVIIAQNYVIGTIGSSTYYSIHIEAGATGVNISNNYLKANGSSALYMASGSEAMIYNNIFEGPITAINSNIHNNIQISGSANLISSNVTNNIGNSTQFPLPNNLQGVDMSAVFDLTVTSPDGKYILIDSISNPAIGYGILGHDCGIFGGLEPYKLSGIPPVPAVYFFFAPAIGSAVNGLPSDIKIKSNN